jgi:hypothetical protein
MAGCPGFAPFYRANLGREIPNRQAVGTPEPYRAGNDNRGRAALKGRVKAHRIRRPLGPVEVPFESYPTGATASFLAVANSPPFIDSHLAPT